MDKIRLGRRAAAATLLFALTLVASMTVTVRAVDYPRLPVMVENTADHDAWADVSFGSRIGLWHIYRAFCLKPGAREKVELPPAPMEAIRVRAEIKHGDCRSGNYRVVEAAKSVFSRASDYDAKIVGMNGSYRINM